MSSVADLHPSHGQHLHTPLSIPFLFAYYFNILIFVKQTTSHSYQGTRGHTAEHSPFCSQALCSVIDLVVRRSIANVYCGHTLDEHVQGMKHTVQLPDCTVSKLRRIYCHEILKVLQAHTYTHTHTTHTRTRTHTHTYTYTRTPHTHTHVHTHHKHTYTHTTHTHVHTHTTHTHTHSN